MLSNEHLKLLLQGVAVVLALHFAIGSMTGEYRNLIAVGLVAVVLVVVNHLFAEYEGFGTKYGLQYKYCMETKLGDGTALNQWSDGKISSEYREKIHNAEKACNSQ